MKIPKSLKIGSATYSVKITQDVDLDAFGMVNHQYHTILIQRDMPADKQESVLFHEILEIVNQRYELDLDHQVITILEEALMAVITDNNLFQGE